MFKIDIVDVYPKSVTQWKALFLNSNVQSFATEKKCFNTGTDHTYLDDALAFDDPIVWLLIAVVIIVLFGASRIPKFARALGEARKEFEGGSKGTPQTTPEQPPPAPAPATASTTLSPEDPLYAAAEKEGIDIRGKTKSEIATELAWKLSKKQQ